MRYSCLMKTLLLIGLLGATPAFGQEAPRAETRKIVASGTATVFVAPDAAVISSAWLSRWPRSRAERTG